MPAQQHQLECLKVHASLSAPHRRRPPAPPQLPDDVAGQIQTVDETLTSDDANVRTAGLLAACRAAGLPAIGPDGTSLTTTGDTVGIP